MDRVELRTLTGLLAPSASQGHAAAGAKGADFSKILDGALSKVSAEANRANELQQRYQLGEKSVSLEETMLAMQTANVSFQALLQTRNRMVSAYQDIMNMQI